jgi:hypothetical protein
MEEVVGGEETGKRSEEVFWRGVRWVRGGRKKSTR